MAQPMTLERLTHGLGVDLDLPYDAAVEGTKAALKERGFGVLTEIDVRQTMKDKLDADFRPYVILGACNPPLAHAALTADLEVGLLLPCTVVVYERDGGSRVLAMDPELALGATANEVLKAVAAQAKHKLEQAIAHIS